MLKLIKLTTILIITLTLQACSNEKYPETSDKYCFARYCISDECNQNTRYFYRINFHSSDGKYIYTQQISRINEKHLNLDLSSGTILEMSAAKLLDEGELLIAWRDEKGRRIDQDNPLIVSFVDCYNQQVNLYAESERVSTFYRIINDKWVSHQMAQKAYDNEIDDVISIYDEWIEGLYPELVTSDQLTEILTFSLFTLLRVRLISSKSSDTGQWHRNQNIDLSELKVVLNDFEPIYTRYNLNYFVLLSLIANHDIPDVEWRIRLYENQIEFTYRWRNERINQGNSFTLNLDVREEYFGYQLSFIQKFGNSCHPSLSNCQEYRPESSHSRLWNSASRITETSFQWGRFSSLIREIANTWNILDHSTFIDLEPEKKD